MPPNRRWIVFADDTGDPGLGGTEYFGYVALGVERPNLGDLNRIAVEFRSAHEMFIEAKADFASPRFRDLVARLSPVCQSGKLSAAACILRKDKYRGPYLRETDEKPRDPHFLRNYCIRHTLELLFDGVDTAENDSIELVLDRVEYSDTQIHNLRDYLRSHYAQDGDFLFPKPWHVTHASSSYVEGLQVAHHLAVLAHHAHMLSQEDAAALASPFMRIKTLVSARPFTIDEEAAKGMGREGRGVKGQN